MRYRCLLLRDTDTRAHRRLGHVRLELPLAGLPGVNLGLLVGINLSFDLQLVLVLIINILTTFVDVILKVLVRLLDHW